MNQRKRSASMNRRLTTRAAVLPLALAFAVCAFAASDPPSPSASKVGEPQKSHGSEHHAAPDDGRKNPSLPHGVINATNPPKQQGEPAQTPNGKDHKSSDEWGNRSEISLAILTAILCLVTMILAFYTALLWRSTKRIAGEAKTSAEEQLRAYLNVFECYAEWERERRLALRIVVFTVQFRNTGQTPARKVNCWANISNEAGPPKFSGPADEPREHMGVSAPKQTGTIQFKHQFDTSNVDQVEAWARGERTLYIYGKLVYCDAFGPERTTIFRYVLPPDGVDEKRGRFKHAGGGNDWT